MAADAPRNTTGSGIERFFWARLLVKNHGTSMPDEARFVTDVPIPGFHPPAEIINWGSRFFVLSERSVVEQDGRRLLIYEEGMIYYVDLGLVTTGE